MVVIFNADCKTKHESDSGAHGKTVNVKIYFLFLFHLSVFSTCDYIDHHDWADQQTSPKNGLYRSYITCR